MKVLDPTFKVDEEKSLAAWASLLSPADPEAIRNAQKLMRAFGESFSECINAHAMEHGFWRPDATECPVIVYAGPPGA